MRLDAFVNHFLRIIPNVVGAMFLSFIFGFILGQGTFIIQFEWLGYLGWIIIALLSLATIFFIITGIYWSVIETKLTNVKLWKAIELYHEWEEKERKGEQR